MADMNKLLRQLSNENTAKTFSFNREEAQKARDFQMEMSNTSHQREVEDLKRAGLNPALSANGGAQAYSASSASGTADNSAVGVMASIYQTKLNNQNAKKIAEMNAQVQRESNANQLQIAKLNQAAQKYSSDKAYAATQYTANHTQFGAAYEAINSALSGTLGADINSAAKKYGQYARKKYDTYVKPYVSSARKQFKKLFK